MLSLSRRDIDVLYGALAALFITRLIAVFIFPLTDTTEARYAEIARKMVETGDWITPQYDYGMPFWGKPPLHTWLSAAGMEVFGVGEFGARIFIFAAAVGLLWLIYDWSVRQTDRNVALVATTILAGSALFFVASAFVMTDLPMVVGTTMCLMGFWSVVTSDSNRTLWGHLFFLGLAIGLLAKGPIAAVLTVMPIGLWILIGHRWRLLKRLPWITGLALTLVLTLPWYAAAELKTPGFLHYFLIGEHVQRFLVPSWSGDLYGSAHDQPKGMIWLFWLAMFLPWTLFCLALLPRAGQVIQAIRIDKTGWRSYLLLWAMAPMLLFTPAANILGAYVLPGLPAASLLLVVLWADLRSEQPSKKIKAAFLAGLATTTILLFGVSMIAALAPDRINLKSQKVLVAKAAELAPGSKVYYWGKRNYSGEFYTSGTAHLMTDINSVKALLGNDARDVLAVWHNSGDQLAAVIDRRFDRIGEFGRYLLFVERAAPGEG